VVALTDEIPPDRRCPICGDLNVNPQPDSLCPKHYPSDDPPEITPLDENFSRGSDPTVDEVRAVAGEEPTDPDRDTDVVRELELIDAFEQSPSRGTSNASSDGHDSQAKSNLFKKDPESFLAAAMGDSEALQNFRPDSVGADVQETAPASAGGVGLPTGVLPLAQLAALDPDERRRVARKRGLDWPTTDEARDRLKETIHEVLRHEDDRVIDAPTSLGKTHTVASTRWKAREDLTGGRPVVHLLETRDARDEAIEIAEEHGGEFLALEARQEACPVAAGDFDPPADEDAGEDVDHKPITVDGQPASEWLEEMCDGRGVHFSAAHRHLEEHNDQGRELPCHKDGECDAIAQWDEYREAEHPLVIATHNFAYAPGIRMANNIVIDEEPDYLQELSTTRVRRAVGAYLRHVDATVQTWEAFVQLARYDGYGDDAANEREALENDLEVKPDREWYFQDPDAHMLAPALARGIFHAEERANQRRVGKTPYEPPRLDATARDADEWNREWVTVVLDNSNEVRSVRVVPDFNAARSVVGLDAHPALPKWQANTVPWIQTTEVLESGERQLWRRYERGLRVVQVGDATRDVDQVKFDEIDHAGQDMLQVEPLDNE
jgi:hypothetical protein